jgi:CDP-diglyceride synthetase
MFIPVPSAIRSKSNSHSHLDALQAQPVEGSTLKTAGRCLTGWLVGYLISSVSSILFFLIGHISPAKPASTAVTWFTAIYGIVFAVIGAAVGASFSRKNALGIGAAIALTIGVVAMWSWYETPDHAHWTQLIAIFLMAPAAQFGSLTRRLTE